MFATKLYMWLRFRIKSRFIYIVLFTADAVTNQLYRGSGSKPPSEQAKDEKREAPSEQEKETWLLLFTNKVSVMVLVPRSC